MEQNYMVALKKSLGSSGQEGLQELYFTERRMSERAAYHAIQKADDYVSRMLSSAVDERPSFLQSIGYSPRNSMYSSNNKQTVCCGRKNAGAHMQCGSCPEK